MKKLIAAMLAALMLAVLLPVNAEESPFSYNAHDREKLLAFFEQADADGVKNGDKLFAGYSPDDVSTWTGVTSDGSGWTFNAVQWNESGSLLALNVYNSGLEGALDLSGCEALVEIGCGSNRIASINADGCGELRYIRASHNAITSVSIKDTHCFFHVDLSFNLLTSFDPSEAWEFMGELDLSHNQLTELDISSTEWISGLICDGNRLKSLTIPAQCRELYYVHCADNELTEITVETDAVCELDCSRNPLESIDIPGVSLGWFDCRGCPLTHLRFDSASMPIELSSAGNGSFAVYLRNVPWDFDEDHGQKLTLTAYADPDPGYQLDAWYDENGNWAYFYEESILWEEDPIALTLTAVFETADVIPGDADGNGIVDTTDALIVLRAALNIDGDPAALLESCDMDGNGIIDSTDALMILRRALNIE